MNPPFVKGQKPRGSIEIADACCVLPRAAAALRADAQVCSPPPLQLRPQNSVFSDEAAPINLRLPTGLCAPIFLSVGTADRAGRQILTDKFQNAAEGSASYAEGVHHCERSELHHQRSEHHFKSPPAEPRPPAGKGHDALCTPHFAHAGFLCAYFELGRFARRSRGFSLCGAGGRRIFYRQFTSGGDPIQTVLVVQTASAGAVYINGRMAGEADASHPLSLPVSPFGALILELRPFDAGVLPLALRIPLSRGAPVLSTPDSRISAALWPGGVLEIELLPERLPAPARFIAQADSVRLLYQPGTPPLLLCESPSAVREYPLPPGALFPAMIPLPSALLLSGERESGDQYAVLLSPDASSLLLSVAGKNIAPLSGGAALRLMNAFGDSVGHAALETWAASPSGWQLTASEPMWEHGAPIRPSTPEAAAVAAIEAAQLGLMQEAAAYFAPSFPVKDILSHAAGFDGCVPLRYALPSGEPAVGLMKLRENVLHIIPARYSVQSGGPNGAYLLTKLEIAENPQM